ncbi:hypothetical protein BSL82_01210 [Tardibacter chloracetimidivorans]|uniref:VRR-NUC domain-containing protein n=1 Tax=Tardibacter chloracetimidivorans TaxID=1921510 RepID=A0A1L3ZR40_9SPHN|nr:hypothetical protein [Tardibacter chloracetimidivorans]API58083.1 hypothetical protein BSL82_01210 [Tardibacter chloracetimidivorans]
MRSPLDDLLAIAEDGDEPWFIEPKDRLTSSEIQRQQSFIAQMARIAPAVDIVAIPNAGRASDWERIQRWREGARAGALDLVITWAAHHDSDRGVFFAEFKDGQKMPSTQQRERLNRLYRMGHKCGVYRTPETLMKHLMHAGAPFVGRIAA